MQKDKGTDHHIVFRCPKGLLKLGNCGMHHLLAVPLLWFCVFENFSVQLQLFHGMYTKVGQQIGSSDSLYFFLCLSLSVCLSVCLCLSLSLSLKHHALNTPVKTCDQSNWSMLEQWTGNIQVQSHRKRELFMTAMGLAKVTKIGSKIKTSPTTPKVWMPCGLKSAGTVGRIYLLHLLSWYVCFTNESENAQPHQNLSFDANNITSI